MLMEILVPIAAFAMFAVVVGQLTGIIGTGMHHRTIREALKAHPESVPQLTAALGSRAPWADPLLGCISLAVAATIGILALFESDDVRTGMLQVAVVPLVIGIVTLAYLRYARPAAVVTRVGE